ncbi:MAG: alpha-1,2-fucosyltransferase [Minisyncoccia bacterium]
MIISRISGGLGNQMFQYAIGRALAIKNDTELALDISSYHTDYHKSAPRSFILDNFNIRAQILNLNASLMAKVERYLIKIVDRYKPINKRKYIIEETFEFSPAVLDAGPNIFISGVWQSEKYFQTIESDIRKEFTLKEPLSHESLKFDSIINANKESVSIHIRRGDYVSNTSTLKKHGVCPPEYYAEAIELIFKKLKTPKFFIFSDDIEYAQSIINTPETTYISSPKIPDYEELVLMSQCKHNILANSTFSWWGAWLNANHNKIVIAPKKWFTTVASTKDLIPENWIRI